MNLKAYRVEAKITQQELAERIGVSQSTIQRYENNPQLIPSNKYTPIQDALGVSPATLLDYHNLYADSQSNGYYGEVAFLMKSDSVFSFEIDLNTRKQIFTQFQKPNSSKLYCFTDMIGRNVYINFNLAKEVFFAAEEADELNVYGLEIYHSRLVSPLGIDLLFYIEEYEVLDDEELIAEIGEDTFKRCRAAIENCGIDINKAWHQLRTTQIHSDTGRTQSLVIHGDELSELEHQLEAGLPIFHISQDQGYGYSALTKAQHIECITFPRNRK